MKNEQILSRFNALTAYFPAPLAECLMRLDSAVKLAVQEIRLRAGRPFAVTVGGTQHFIRPNGSTALLFHHDCVVPTEQQLNECFIRLCNHSVYAHQEELCDGYIMLAGGHRVGICGTFIQKNGQITGVRDISSLNLRIAKEMVGCSKDILPSYAGESILICGGPGSGKTTLLRDIVRRLSNGELGTCHKVSVIDSRGELAAVANGVPTADLGQTCDIITGCGKGRGIEMALRTQFPEVIAFDELGNCEEVEKISESLSAGAAVITTAHAGDVHEINRREPIVQLLRRSVVDRIIFCPRVGFSYQQLLPAEIDCAFGVGATV